MNAQETSNNLFNARFRELPLGVAFSWAAFEPGDESVDGLLPR
jgi:hypothetical protein